MRSATGGGVRSAMVVGWDLQFDGSGARRAFWELPPEARGRGAPGQVPRLRHARSLMGLERRTFTVNIHYEAFFYAIGPRRCCSCGKRDCRWH